MSPSARRLGILLVAIWIIVGIGGSVWFFNRPQYTERHENERAIYRTLLTESRYWGGSLLVEETTTPYFQQTGYSESFLEANPEFETPVVDRYASYAETYPALQPETLQDAEKSNQTIQDFPSDLWLYFLVKYETVKYEEIDLDSTESGLYLSFSSVGFNPDFTQAMVYVYFSCGILCGGGDVYFLEKVEGRWRVITHDTVLYL